jgi:hypothetical protein
MGSLSTRRKSRARAWCNSLSRSMEPEAPRYPNRAFSVRSWSSPFIAGPQLEVATDYSANGPVAVTFLGAPMAFTWGVPLDVLMGFATEASFTNPDPAPCPAGHGDVVRGCPVYYVAAVMDFSDTVTLSAINVLDANGNSVRNFPVGSEAERPTPLLPRHRPSFCVGILLILLSVCIWSNARASTGKSFVESSRQSNWTWAFAGAACRADRSHSYRLHRDPA